MAAVTQQLLLASSGVATRAFTDNAHDSSGATTYTFSSKAIGVATADRYVVVIVGLTRLAATASVSSATIAGSSATIHCQVSGTNGGISAACSAIIGVAVPAGTTATIVITANGACTSGSVGVYALYGLSTTTPFATGTNNASPGTSVSATCNVPANGVAIAGGTVSASAQTMVTTGATQDFAQETQGGASGQLMAAETARSFSSSSASNAARAIAVATWH